MGRGRQAEMMRYSPVFALERSASTRSRQPRAGRSSRRSTGGERRRGLAPSPSCASKGRQTVAGESSRAGRAGDCAGPIWSRCVRSWVVEALRSAAAALLRS
eukprot:755478-Hanusia_phi.AAC.2